jgi:phosphate transport system substrate-binding protein
MDEFVKGFQAKCPAPPSTTTPRAPAPGIKQFTSGQVDFAGSDSALKADKGGLRRPRPGARAATRSTSRWSSADRRGLQPPDVESLTLNGEVAAKIFNGTIKTWNDPAIAALNEGTELPDTCDQGVRPLGRVRAPPRTSRSTSRRPATGNWKTEPSKQWAGAGEGREKSSVVQEAIKTEEGAIGYIEWSYAQDAQLGMAKIDAGSGPVELTGETAGKALEAAKPEGSGNDLRLKLDFATKEAGVYPIVLVTYEIVCSKGLEPGEGEAGPVLPEVHGVRRGTGQGPGDRLRAPSGRRAHQGRRCHRLAGLSAAP